MSVKEFAYLIQNQFCLKVNEIAFINTLEAQNKKMEVMSRHQVYYTRVDITVYQHGKCFIFVNYYLLRKLLYDLSNMF
jgi:Rps23 Pro-64 3,4-dihydroxylase Tpa1-like proline 4-hydroxylase